MNSFSLSLSLSALIVLAACSNPVHLYPTDGGGGSGGAPSPSGSASVSSLPDGGSPDDADSSTSAACEGTTPCGGDVVGTWKLTGSCEPTGAISWGDCTLTEDGSGVTESGTMVFTSSLSVTQTLTVSGTIHATFSGACIPSQGTSCKSVGAGHLGTGAVCPEVDAGPCSCTMTYTGAPTSVTATYSLVGNVIRTNNAGAVQDYDYCVRGNQLFIMAQQPALGGRLVLERQ